MAPGPEKDLDLESNDGFVEDFGLDDANDPDAQHVGSFEARLKAAKAEMRSKGRFTNDSEVERFLGQYDDIGAKSVAKWGGNLLHALVEVVVHNSDSVKPDGVELLLRRIVERWPSHLEEVDGDGYNPVFMAIKGKHPVLVNYMVSACKVQAHLESALSSKGQEGNTCLHAVFINNSNADTAKLLVSIASDEALAVQNDLGKTPMHHAVAFKQCTDARREVIALFIERDIKARQGGDRSKQTFLDLHTTSRHSVYREHEQTREPVAKRWQEFLENERQKAEARQNQAGRSAPRDLRDRARDLRQTGGSAEPSNDRGTDKHGNHGDGDGGLDEREKQRRERRAEEEAKKKAEEEAKKKAEEEARKKADETNRLTGGETNHNLSVPGQQAVRTGTAARSHEPAPNTPLKRRGTAPFDSNPKQGKEKEKEAARPAPKSRANSNIQMMPKLLRNSDAVLMELKLHYMRTRTAEMVISFLYGNNIDDVQISFDYDRLPRNLRWNEFVKRFGADAKSGLRFDRVLQYVTFPRVQVTWEGVQADLVAKAELKRGVRHFGKLGRKDMKFFFDWLYNKGVRHVIRVSVEDSGNLGDPVHSDKVIQESLERFVVEHLDWKKTDLDPETVLRISSKVDKRAPTLENPAKTEVAPDRQLRQLDLVWSGSNAVLRGWSEPGGLAVLPHLQKICIFLPPSDKLYDSEAWIHSKIADFETRLNASRQAARAQTQTQPQLTLTAPDALGVAENLDTVGDVEVTPVDSSTEPKPGSFTEQHATSTDPLQGVNGHQWLDSTAKFAAKMTKFWDTTVSNFLESRQNRRTPQGIEEDIVLALIDDGVDMFDTLATNQILEGKSFDFHGGKVRPPFSSANGHGTVMASMILRVCPMVKIYPIRLKTYQNPEGKNMNIDAGYAAQAIQAALDKKATIISMSWTVPMNDTNTEAKDRLHQVLEQAVADRVLMFCSAPDKGKFSGLDYPSGPWRDHGRFFRIGAAASDGTVFGWTPEDGITYVLPGVDVIREQAATRSFDAHSTQKIPNRMIEFRETGSSVATALAAGLAAMIIYCVKASILVDKTANESDNPLLGRFPDNAAHEIAHPDQMRRAFSSLGDVTQNKFVQVWQQLDEVTKHLEHLQLPRSAPETKLQATKAFVDFGQRLWSAAKQEH